jgi:hypothetical protein
MTATRRMKKESRRRRGLRREEARLASLDMMTEEVECLLAGQPIGLRMDRLDG